MSPFIQLLGPGKPDRAFVFPGQGSQFVGMGKDLYEQFQTARDLYDQADEILGFSLSRLCFEGPEEELVQTRNAQPAIAVTSLALLRVSAEVSPQILPQPAYMAGHSLGEYVALVAAGAISFEESVRLLRLRGELMQSAGDAIAGTMAAVIGLDTPACEAICRRTGAEICTDNAPGQIVIGGPLEAVQMAIEAAKAEGASNTIPLNVSGAFHTSLMRPAAEGLAPALAAAEICDPIVPIVANCTATPVADATSIQVELVNQVTRTVQWTRTIQFLADQGVHTFIEFGPGRVLTSTIRRMQKESTRINVADAVGVNVAL